MPDLETLDEARDFYEQTKCQEELDEVLTRLVKVVMVSKLPVFDKLSLINDVAHLRDHIHSETNGMRAEMQCRRN